MGCVLRCGENTESAQLAADGSVFCAGEVGADKGVWNSRQLGYQDEGTGGGIKSRGVGKGIE